MLHPAAKRRGAVRISESPVGLHAVGWRAIGRVEHPSPFPRVLWLLLALALCRPAFGQRWPDERALGPFRVHADFALEPIVPMLRTTARLSDEIPDLLELPRSEETIWVYLFQSPSTYRHYLEQYFPDVPFRRALYIKPRGPGMVFAHVGEGFEQDLRHETTHAILHTLLPEVPLWLDEGLAEYFEAAVARADETPHASVLLDVRGGQAPRLAELEAKTEMKQMRSADYQHAWAWVHFLLHGPEPARQVFRDYLRDLRIDAPAAALTPRLARRCPDFENEFVTHLRSIR